MDYPNWDLTMLSGYLTQAVFSDTPSVAGEAVRLLATEGRADRMLADISRLTDLNTVTGSDRLVSHVVRNTLGLENMDFVIQPVRYSPAVVAHLGVYDAVKQCYDVLKQAADKALSNTALAPQLDSDLGNTIIAANLKRKSKLIANEITYSQLACLSFVGMQDNNHVQGLTDFIRAREMIINRVMAQMEATLGRVNHLAKSANLEDTNSAEGLRFARNKILAEYNVADVSRMLPSYDVVDDTLVRSRLFAQYDAIAYGQSLPAVSESGFIAAFKRQIFDVCPKDIEPPTSIKTIPMPVEVMDLYLANAKALLGSLRGESARKRLLGIFHELDLAMAFCVQIIDEMKSAATANATIDESTFLVLREHLSMIAAFSSWASMTISGLESVSRLAARSALAVVKESLAAYK